MTASDRCVRGVLQRSVMCQCTDKTTTPRCLPRTSTTTQHLLGATFTPTAITLSPSTSLPDSKACFTACDNLRLPCASDTDPDEEE